MRKFAKLLLLIGLAFALPAQLLALGGQRCSHDHSSRLVTNAAVGHSAGQHPVSGEDIAAGGMHGQPSDAHHHPSGAAASDGPETPCSHCGVCCNTGAPLVALTVPAAVDLSESRRPVANDPPNHYISAVLERPPSQPPALS